jgi:hypothetical protein
MGSMGIGKRGRQEEKNNESEEITRSGCAR